jgi:hypothetical protein
MTPTQKKFVELEKQKVKVKEYFENLKKAVDEIAEEVGVGGFFQDEEGTVYKVVEPEGRYINYEKLSYKRTRRVGEERGDLSIKDAEAAGFTVPAKR